MNPDLSMLPVYDVEATTGADVPTLSATQSLIAPSVGVLTILWWCIWCSVGVAVCAALYRRAARERVAKP